MRRWLHRLRWSTCDMCGREFRKGRGGGVSRNVVCSAGCWANAWAQWMRKPLRPVTWEVES